MVTFGGGSERRQFIGTLGVLAGVLALVAVLTHDSARVSDDPRAIWGAIQKARMTGDEQAGCKLIDIATDEQRETIKSDFLLMGAMFQVTSEGATRWPSGSAFAAKLKEFEMESTAIGLGAPAVVSGDTATLGPPGNPIRFRRIDDQWRVEAEWFMRGKPATGGASSLVVAGRLATRLNDLAKEIKQGKYSEEQAQGQVGFILGVLGKSQKAASLVRPCPEEGSDYLPEMEASLRELMAQLAGLPHFISNAGSYNSDEKFRTGWNAQMSRLSAVLVQFMCPAPQNDRFATTYAGMAESTLSIARELEPLIDVLEQAVRRPDSSLVLAAAQRLKNINTLMQDGQQNVKDTFEKETSAEVGK